MMSLIALKLIPLLSLAAGSADLKSAVLGSYDGSVQISREDTGRSFYGCSLRLTRITGKDPINGEMRGVKVKEYGGGRNENGIAVILLPPTGGENILDRAWSNDLCSRGARVYLVQKWFGDDFVSLDPVMHDHGAIRALHAIRHVVELAQQDGMRSIRILGTSVGAMSAAFAYGVDSRIEKATLIVGGLDFPGIVAHSTEEGAAALRKSRMEAFGLKSVEEYEGFIRKRLSIEPSDYDRTAMGQGMQFILATADCTVPTLNQESFARRYQPADLKMVAGDHLAVIKRASFHWSLRKSILQHLLSPAVRN